MNDVGVSNSNRGPDGRRESMSEASYQLSPDSVAEPNYTMNLEGTDLESPEGPHEEASLNLELSPPSRRRTALVLVGLLLLSGLGFVGLRTLSTMTAKPEKARRNSKLQITPVTVAKVTRKTVPIQLQAIGTVQASSTVAVTPQATGQITGVYFQKGQMVEKGQLLFTLDNRTQLAAIQQAQGTLNRDLAQVRQAQANLAKDQGLVQQAQSTLNKDLAQVNQAEATLAKDKAQTTYAQATSTRYNDLYRQGGISKDQAQQYAANSASSAATLQVDQAAIANANAVASGDRVAIENARKVVDGDYAAIANAQAVVESDQGALKAIELQAAYTKVYAPIQGRAGNILVMPGNVVQANSSSPLVNLTKVHPIQVSFAVPESNLPAIQKHMENGRLKVNVSFAGNTEQPITGYLTFLNNTVDTSTGTIQLIGDFNNASGKLFPGQFVTTTLILNQEPNAIVVPSQAVQNGPNGQFVFVVNANNTVNNVPVTANDSMNGLSVVQKGLEPGQQVVTDGQANLVTGSKIRLKTASDAEDDFSDLFGSSSGSSSNSGSGKASGSGSGTQSGTQSGAGAGPASGTQSGMQSGTTRIHKHRAAAPNSSTSAADFAGSPSPSPQSNSSSQAGSTP